MGSLLGRRDRERLLEVSTHATDFRTGVGMAGGGRRSAQVAACVGSGMISFDILQAGHGFGQRLPSNDKISTVD